MGVRIALGGDTMLGRGVGEEITDHGPYGLFAREVVEELRRADLRLLNLECCISTRGTEEPTARFHFRAPPGAVETLRALRVDCVTLANNHTLDYGDSALEDTLTSLREAGIQTVGAGRNQAEARAPAILNARNMTIAVLGVTDHPQAYAATETTPGVAYAPLNREIPAWLTKDIQQLSNIHNAVVITPHWGPNMTTAPQPYIRAAAQKFLEAGATLVAGHSAHVFHAATPRVIYDLGDLIDDYIRDRKLRNDLSLLWTTEIKETRQTSHKALPLHLTYAHTSKATGEDQKWIKTRLATACTEFDTEVIEQEGLTVVTDEQASNTSNHEVKG
ncbi:CapA family protein [Actinomadura sp. DC4]|uniref:CapA family protein n=1 Tax=Actinomadura sp. DC4 TaxID=3055069 RepID=UPI0025B01B24|nr:CapA family protein [Actinomadura sp. DC4]MDN3352961.1 CapA family protein [Actinomadura sp. DC4]